MKTTHILDLSACFACAELADKLPGYFNQNDAALPLAIEPAGPESDMPAWARLFCINKNEITPPQRARFEVYIDGKLKSDEKREWIKAGRPIHIAENTLPGGARIVPADLWLNFTPVTASIYKSYYPNREIGIDG